MTVAPDPVGSHGDHVVHFYDADDQLITAACEHLRAGLAAGASAVIIATPAHREQFETALDDGYDASAVVMLDAVETLDRFRVDGVPQRARFDEVIRPLVADLAAANGAVTAFGEMVGVLWEAGDVTAALDLERWWNALAADVALSLFCGYSASSCVDLSTAAAFTEVCRLHTDLIDAAPARADAEIVSRFPSAAVSATLARGFVADTLSRWGRHDLIDDGMLVVSELASNAVLHARSDFSVSLTRHGDAVELDVGDSMGSLDPRRIPELAVHGRGLVLVDAVASDRAHHMTSQGKLIRVRLQSPVARVNGG